MEMSRWDNYAGLICGAQSENTSNTLWYTGLVGVKRWKHILYVGRGGSLVDSSPFVRMTLGPNFALAATLGPWASPSLAVACGASAWNSDTISVLCRKRLWVVVDLKRRYRNSLNEWMNTNLDMGAKIGFSFLIIPLLLYQFFLTFHVSLLEFNERDV